MKSIHTLISDVQELLESKDVSHFNAEFREGLSQSVSQSVTGSLGDPRTKNALRLSQMGPRCPKALWHSIHTPELAEDLPAWAKFKYTYGHIIEGLAISLIKAAGHSVTGEQDELVVDGVCGHRDCVVDGCIVDVKSSASFSFQKFKDGSIRDNDLFGYLDQLDGYLVGSLQDPLVTVKDRAYLLAIDKQMGHMVLYEHHLREHSIRTRIQEYKEIVGRVSPPNCTCKTVAEGKSGNFRLDTQASYNMFKHCCFPSLRTFLYASGPLYLTKVVRVPDVTEVDRYGKYIYH